MPRLAIAPLALIAIAIIPTMVQAAPQPNPVAVSSSVAGFRQNINAVLTSYYTTYGNRLTPAEQRQMTSLMTQVDRELASLQAKTQVSANLARQHATKSKQHRAARDAAKSFDIVYSHAMTSLEEVQPILQPKLSLFEALRAKSDLDQSLQTFETLGTQLHALAG